MLVGTRQIHRRDHHEQRTCFAEKASDKDKEAALDVLLDRFHHAYTADPLLCMRTLADKLSYISAGTYRDLVLDTRQDAESISLE